MATASPVSVLVAARDEAATLPGALASVRAWASQVVVVVDPRTTDATGEVAARLGARVFEHPFTASSDQLGWGMARCAHDWVFILDADERVDARLAAAIGDTLAAPTCPAYRVRRRNVAFGRPLRFGDWGGDRVVRLVDRRQVTLVGGMHFRVEASRVGALSGHLEHHTLRSFQQYLPKLHCYAAEGAANLVAAGARAGMGRAVLRAAWRFCRAYLLRLGVLDGGPGLAVAALSAYGTFLKWAMAWELGRQRRGQGGATTADGQRP